jgi:P-type Cu2+ transporter
MATTTSQTCQHCRSPLPPARSDARYCCAGCEVVAGLLASQNLGRYYDLAPATLPAVGVPPAPQSHAWLEPLVATAAAAAAGGPLTALELDVQGVHCAGCVWLMNELLRRQGGTAITVNPALGKVRMVYDRTRFDVGAWVSDVERFGYRFGPSRKQSSRVGSDLALRLGISLALTMNVMLFSISFYLGLSPVDGALYRLFTWLAAALATAVVVVGGGVFFRSAALALRRRILHLDLPIALGILLVYTTSLVRLLRGQGGELGYFDTLSTFITLMLVGRWLQQRVVERNRRLLLEDDGASGIFVRRLSNGIPRAIPAPAVRTGDHLLIAPGELVPVDATLSDANAAISTDWITGEPTPRAIGKGELAPAGSFNAGRAAFTVEARTDFASSPLGMLLRQGTPSAPSLHLRFWDRLARRWVLQVLAVASLGLVLWLPAGPDAALDVAVSLLVITCPCAIGIALPLAYELTQARLRRAGFFVRTPDLVDRLERVRTLIFDKTGTLTLGRLALADEEAVTGLDPEARDAAYNLACRSGHPVAGCLARALERAGARFDPGVAVTEVPGEGLVTTAIDAGKSTPHRPEWRLGRPRFAEGADRAHGDNATVLARDAEPVARFSFREVLRPDAGAALAALRADGYALHLLSGDAPARVGALATALGLPAEQAHGWLTPENKAAAVAALDHGDTLFLGDGINDSLAFERAFCAGTVAVDRPVLPGKSAFFIAGEGLGPLRLALREARRLRQVVRRVFALSLTYNVVAVSACLAGLMTPLRAAVSMPASSLGILLFTLWQLRERDARTERRTSAAHPIVQEAGT